MDGAERKLLFWVGSSRKDLRDFPEDVKDVMGHALDIAQQGGKSTEAKPLKGFGGASVIEIVDDYDGDTYRSVYTVKFGRAIYVLHAFQKKSKRGSETPKHEIDRIKARLADAEEHYKEWIASQERKER